MRKTLVIVGAAGVAGLVAVGAIATRSSEPDNGLQPVAADVDTAPEPPRITSARPATRQPTGRVVAGPVEADRNGEPPERDDDDDRDRRRRGPWDRGFDRGEPMNPEEFAERYEERRARWDEIRERYDADGDGELNEEERRAMREAFRERMRDRWRQRMVERFDADGDGELSEEERIEAEAEREARRAEMRARMTERFDTDGDGELSEQEEQAAREQFRRDRGGGRGGRGGWQEMVSRYDEDGDGELNLDESYEAYLDRFTAREREQFRRRYDANRDGGVDTSDFESFLVRYKAEDPEADVNGDGLLNQQDVDRFRDMMINQP